MYLIDTNIHAAYILQAFEKGHVSKQYLAAYEKIPLKERVVSDFILNEFETLLIRVAPSRFKFEQEQKDIFKESVFAYIDEIFARYTLVTVSQDILFSAHNIYKRFANIHYISFTDSLLLATAKQNGLHIFSKDKRLNEQAAELGIAYFKPSF